MGTRFGRQIRRIVPNKAENRIGLQFGIQAALVTFAFLLSTSPVFAQDAICETAIGDFTNSTISAVFALALVSVFVGMIVGFGFRGFAFSGRAMGVLSSMSSGSLIGLVGVVFTVVIVSWVLGFSPIDIPQGCVPL